MFHPHFSLPPSLSFFRSLCVIVCSFCDDIRSDVESHQRSSLRPQKPPEWTSGMNHIIFISLSLYIHTFIHFSIFSSRCSFSPCTFVLCVRALFIYLSPSPLYFIHFLCIFRPLITNMCANTDARRICR